MKKLMKISCLLVFVFLCQITFAQSNKELALSKGQEAIKLMDDGKIAESIKLLEEAQRLDPDKLDYPYEIALATYLKEDYKGAIKILEKLIDHKDVTERFFQLLGNSYDNIGKSDKAFDAYDSGLKKFPNSGMLYLEKGNVHWGKKEFDKALTYYEKGIELDPAFPSNYYRATLIYCGSTEEVWGMIYGEIFMNLERNSKRTAEISKLLFNTYKSQIIFKSDTSFSVSFSKNATISMADLKDPNNIKLPYGVGIYEPTLMFSIIGEKVIDINSLDRIRTKFVNLYFERKNEEKYPNILFTYQNSILKAGHLEAYNHWLMMKGDEDGFDKWYTNNKDKWEAFIKWYTDNRIKIDESNKFYRSQY